MGKVKFTMRLYGKEIEFIKNNYDKMSLRAIASKIGCSYEAVNNNLKKLGIQKKRVLKSKIWDRKCKGGCGTIISNDKNNEYCLRCRHLRHSKTFYLINAERVKRFIK